MSVVAAAIIGTAAVGAYNQNKANRQARDAANQQQEGINEAQQIQLNASREASGILEPISSTLGGRTETLQDYQTQFDQVGQQGIAGLQAQTGQLDVNQFLNPYMDFARQQGTAAIESSAAARGGLLSGATLKNLTEYSTNLAQQNYNNAVTQALNNRGQQVDIAQSQSNIGQTGVNIAGNLQGQALNALGQQANIVGMQGTNSANLAMTSANVGAQATAGERSPLATGIQQGLGMYAGYLMGSDEEMKREIASITDEEIDEFLSNLEPVEFEYDDDAIEEGKGTEGKKMGILAQDAEKSKLGKTLVEEEDDDKMIDIPSTVGALLASAASLNKRVKRLEGEK